MRKTWKINHNYEEQLEDALNQLDSTENEETGEEFEHESDDDVVTELPNQAWSSVKNDSYTSNDSPYRSRKFYLHFR